MSVEEDKVRLAHDALHKGNTEACHDYLHSALGIENEAKENKGLATSLKNISKFDRRFRKLCEKYKIRAAYISIEEAPFEDGTPGVRYLGGGDSRLDDVMTKAFRQYMERRNAS